MDKVAACVLHGNDFVIRMQRGIRYRFTIERVNGDLYSVQSGQYDVSSFAVYRTVVCCVICYTGTAGSQGMLSMAMRAPAFSVFPRKPNCMRLLPASWSSGRLTLVHSLEPSDRRASLAAS